MEELSKTKIEQLNKMPIIETSVSKSKGWVILKTSITQLYPESYMAKVMESNGKAKKK